jgi:hypothetical protein
MTRRPGFDSCEDKRLCLRIRSSGLYRRVVGRGSDVSEEHIASIFRVEAQANQENHQKLILQSTSTISCPPYPSTQNEDGGNKFLQNVS